MPVFLGEFPIISFVLFCLFFLYSCYLSVLSFYLFQPLLFLMSASFCLFSASLPLWMLVFLEGKRWKARKVQGTSQSSHWAETETQHDMTARFSAEDRTGLYNVCWKKYAEGKIKTKKTCSSLTDHLSCQSNNVNGKQFPSFPDYQQEMLKDRKPLPRQLDMNN